MLSRPTVVELLRAAKANLDSEVIPELSSQGAIVAATMIGDTIDHLMQRIPVETVWMKEETEEQRRILGELATIAERSASSARTRLAAAVQTAPPPPPPLPESFGPEAIQREYSEISQAMADAVTALHEMRDEGEVELADSGLAKARAYMRLRIDHELAITGQGALVGRG